MEKLPHIVLPNPPEISIYSTPPSRITGSTPPVRNREMHGRYLKGKLAQAWEAAEQEKAVSHATRTGVYLEFKSDPK